MPRLTVLLSSFNRPHRLASAIESVLAQTHRDLALWILDDASPDPCVHDTIDHYLNLDPRANVIRGTATAEDKTQSCTFGQLINRGLALTDSQYVSYLCDSCTYYPDRCERLLAHLALTPACDAAWGAQRWQLVDAAGKVLEDRTRAPMLAPEVHQGRDWVASLDRFNTVDHNSVVERRNVVPWSESPVDWHTLDWRRWQKMARLGMRFDMLGCLGEHKVCGPDSSGRLHDAGKSIAEVVAIRSAPR